MKTIMKWGLAAAVLALVFALPSSVGQVLKGSKALPISATICATYDPAFEGVGAWVGFALVQIGNADPVEATVVDRNMSHGLKNNMAIYGTEVITFTFADGSFELVGRYEGSKASTPGLYTLHEVGTISNGTGRYARMSGHASVEGPFLFPFLGIVNGPAPWMAELHGVMQSP